MTAMWLGNIERYTSRLLPFVPCLRSIPHPGPAQGGRLLGLVFMRLGKRPAGAGIGQLLKLVGSHLRLGQCKATETTSVCDPSGVPGLKCASR